MRVFISGTAGFIGFHLARRLLCDGHFVTGYDGMTPYYDPRLKIERHRILKSTNRFSEWIGQLEDMPRLTAAVEEAKPDVIVHLAAQAGVRYSLENPSAYISSNIVGSYNILESARTVQPKHLLLASTSSAYGANDLSPFRETDKADLQITLYAATKKSMEVMSHSYSHLWRIPTTCFRFFTVYGPWGRPDMALFKFVEAIENDRPIDIYGFGQMRRDFTFIDDLIESIVRLIGAVPEVGTALADAGDTLSPVAPWRLVNIGGGHPVDLMDFVSVLEKKLGKRARKNMLPMQPGDMVATEASCELLERLTKYRPSTGIEEGVSAFIDWYGNYRTLKDRDSGQPLDQLSRT
jgi:UDP-glucuronate 4-epimerase